MKTFSVLLWLKVRLLLNQMRHTINQKKLTFQYLFFFIYSVFATLFGTIIGKMFLIKDFFGEQNLWLQKSNRIIFLFFITIFIGKVFFSGQYISRISIKKLAYYPLNKFKVKVFNIFLSSLDFWNIIFFCLLIGYLLGIDVILKSITSFSIFLLFSLIIILSMQILLELIDELVALFRKIYLLIKGVILIFTVTIFIYYKDYFINISSCIFDSSPINLMNKIIYINLFFTKEPFDFSSVFNAILFLFFESSLLLLLTTINTVLSSDNY